MPYNEELFHRVTGPTLDATAKDHAQRIEDMAEKFLRMRREVYQAMDEDEDEAYEKWQGLMVRLFVEEALLMSLAVKKAVDCEGDAHESALMDVSLLSSLSATILDRYQEKDVLMEMISREVAGLLRSNAEFNAAGRA